MDILVLFASTPGGFLDGAPGASLVVPQKYCCRTVICHVKNGNWPPPWFSPYFTTVRDLMLAGF